MTSPVARGSRAVQRPASTAAMKSSTARLNASGSSRFSVWPVLGSISRPLAGRVRLRKRAGSRAWSSSSPAMMSVGADNPPSGPARVSRAGRPALDAAQGQRGAGGVMAAQGIREDLPAARILVLVLNPRRAGRVGGAVAGAAQRFEALGGLQRGVPEGGMAGRERAVAHAGDGQRAHEFGMGQAEMQGREAPRRGRRHGRGSMPRAASTEARSRTALSWE